MLHRVIFWRVVACENGRCEERSVLPVLIQNVAAFQTFLHQLMSWTISAWLSKLILLSLPFDCCGHGMSELFREVWAESLGAIDAAAIPVIWYFILRTGHKARYLLDIINECLLTVRNVITRVDPIRDAILVKFSPSTYKLISLYAESTVFVHTSHDEVLCCHVHGYHIEKVKWSEKGKIEWKEERTALYEWVWLTAISTAT